MPATIVYGTNLQPNAPGAYIQVIAPPLSVTGIPTDVIGIAGTASWGPLNSPVLIGDPTQIITNFGGITAAALTDIHDLCTDLTIAFNQAGANTLQAYGIRVSDGTDIKATDIIKDTGGTVTGITITALYSGTLGNSISIIIAAGARPNTFDVTLTPFSGGLVEVYPGLPNAAPFWAALVSALANGLPNVRGPSALVRGTIGTSVLGPTAATTTLSSGTDGRSSITSAELLGSNATSPYTGLYTLFGTNPPVGIIWSVGLTDTTVATSFASLAQALPVWGLFSAPSGAASNVATMISTLQATGVASPNVSFCGNWTYWYDPVNALLRLVPPYAFIGGTTAALPPEQSPLNAPVNSVVGTERNNPYGTPLPFSSAELGALDKAGVIIINNPSPGGQYWGIQSGRNTATNGTQQPVEYTRLTNFLALSLAGTIGQFVGQNQSTQTNDPLRNQVQHVLDTFTSGLSEAGRIDSALNTCGFAQTGNPNNGINTPATIASHFLYARSDVKYLSSVWYFILSLQGGTTVVTTGNASGPGAP